MRKTFSVARLIRNIGEQVTQQFEEAGLGTTGSIVGEAREDAVRRTLQRVLAGNNRVTSGVVIDSYENASRQTDIVIHEADMCPVFTVGGPDGGEYIPCEGVWAAGEVKSRLRREDLRDICDHSMSVRKLRRYTHREASVIGDDSVSFRHYGVGMALSGTRQEEFDQTRKECDRVFTFGIVGAWDISDSDATEEMRAFMRQSGREMAPNMIIGIEKGLVLPAQFERGQWSPVLDWSKAAGIAVSRSVDDRWRKLVGILNFERTNRRTVALNAFTRYTTLSGGIKPFSAGIETQTVGNFTIVELD